MSLPTETMTRHPHARSSRYTNFTTRDGIWTAIVIVALLILSIVSGQQNALLILGAIVLVASLIILPKYDERIYWLPVMALNNSMITRLKKGVIWKKGQSESIIPIRVYDVGTTGLFVNYKQNTVGFVLTAPGSPIASLDASGQKMYQDLIAECITSAANANNTSVQFSFGFRARPENPYVLYRALAERGEPSVVFHENNSEDSSEEHRRNTFLRENMDEWSVVLNMSSDVIMYVAVSIHSPESVKLLSKKKIDTVTLRRLPIMRLRGTVVSYFQRRIEPDATICDAKSAEQFLRGWDVVGLQDYYEQAEQRWTDEATVADHWMPKSSIQSGHDHVRMDGTYGATLKLTRFPVAQSTQLATPYQGRDIYNSQTRWHARAIVGETLKGTVEYSMVKTGTGIKNDVKSVIGFDQTDPRSERENQEANERLETLDKSGFAQYYNMYVAISAASVEELEDEVLIEYERLMTAGFGPIRIIGAQYQLPAYMTACTGIDLL